MSPSLRSWPEIQAALPDFMNAHVARYKATHRVSVFSTPERRFFLEELARRFSGRSGDFEYADDWRPAGGLELWVSISRSWFWYQPTFDIRSEENSPGHCLLARIVTEACEMDVKVRHLGLGSEGYKERFGNSTRQTLDAANHATPLIIREIARYRIATE